MCRKITVTLLLPLLAFISFAQTFNVEKYGARSNQLKNQALAIQKAIDAAHDAGGGTVVLTSGIYYSGSIQLKSNVVLQVNP
ncbi:MAG: hypothetical protein MUE95_06990, partial [Cyclobacteriaceae bacterium]|nr:hypothetical protein [Cyclobacteriaceae bacterium]